MKAINQTEVLERIGKNLYMLRIAREETLATTASASEIGESHSILSKIENGRYDSLRLDILIKLCNYFHVSLQQIMELEMTQIFNYSLHNQTGTNTQNNEISSGYLLHIDYLTKELEQYKNKLGLI